VGVVFGPFFFLRGFRALRMKRHIINVPRSSVRAAALGPVEVSGKAVGPYTLVAPFSKTECLCYWVVRESDTFGPFSTTSQKRCAPLYLDDGTGRVMISPHAIEIRLPPSFSGAVDQFPCGPGDPISPLRMIQPESSNTSRQIQEYVVRAGDPIYVLGSLQTNPWAQKDAEVTELSRIGPGFISEGEADIFRREAFSFLDPSLPAGEVPDRTRPFDLYPPTILMKGPGPFLISNKSEREILSSLSWKSLLYIWGGPLAALWGLWQFLIVRLGFVRSPWGN
jgi:hypothetical protein